MIAPINKGGYRGIWSIVLVNRTNAHETNCIPKMSFEEFNKVCVAANLLPTKKIKELNLEVIYKVTELRKVQTKYGAKVIITIDDTFVVFLPARASKMLEEHEELFIELVESCSQNKLSVQYLGGQYNSIEWKKL